MKPYALIIKTWIPLALIITAFCGLTYGSVQQVYRSGADDPQIQMAEDAAAALENGADVPSVVSGATVSVASSLAPFLIVYDQNEKVVASSVSLDGVTPQLPAGVLAASRSAGENRVTWQPSSSVRIAAVIVAYKNGYALAGRSLREVEQREERLVKMISIGWMLALAATLVAVAGSEVLSARKSA